LVDVKLRTPFVSVSAVMPAGAPFFCPQSAPRLPAGSPSCGAAAWWCQKEARQSLWRSRYGTAGMAL